MVFKSIVFKLVIDILLTYLRLKEITVENDNSYYGNNTKNIK